MIHVLNYQDLQAVLILGLLFSISLQGLFSLYAVPSSRNQEMLWPPSL